MSRIASPDQPIVNVFLRTAGEPGPTADDKRDALDAFAAGLAAHGVTARLIDTTTYEPCDLAVLYGTHSPEPITPQREFRNEICRRHRGDLIVVETPFLGRRVRQRPALQRWLFRAMRRKGKRVLNESSQFRVGVNGAFCDTADFNNSGSPSTRWNQLAGQLKLRVAPYRRHGEHILVLGQVPADASLRGTDIFAWMRATVAELRRHSDRPIVVRPHPASGRHDLEAFSRALRASDGVTLDHPPKGTLDRALRGCWVVVAYSSSGTVDALLGGVPAIAMNPANIAWPVTDHHLEAVNRPTLHDRTAWLHDLAYTQWSADEMRSGRVWRHLRPALGRKLAAAA